MAPLPLFVRVNLVLIFTNCEAMSIDLSTESTITSALTVSTVADWTPAKSVKHPRRINFFIFKSNPKSTQSEFRRSVLLSSLLCFQQDKIAWIMAQNTLKGTKYYSKKPVKYLFLSITFQSIETRTFSLVRAEKEKPIEFYQLKFLIRSIVFNEF